MPRTKLTRACAIQNPVVVPPKKPRKPSNSKGRQAGSVNKKTAHRNRANHARQFVGVANAPKATVVRPPTPPRPQQIRPASPPRPRQQQPPAPIVRRPFPQAPVYGPPLPPRNQQQAQSERPQPIAQNPIVQPGPLAPAQRRVPTALQRVAPVVPQHVAPLAPQPVTAVNPPRVAPVPLRRVPAALQQVAPVVPVVPPPAPFQAVQPVPAPQGLPQRFPPQIDHRTLQQAAPFVPYHMPAEVAGLVMLGQPPAPNLPLDGNFAVYYNLPR